MFNFLIVILTGRHFWPVAEEIKRHKAEVIRCYNPKFYDALEDGKPIIERMEFRLGLTIENMVETISQAAAAS